MALTLKTATCAAALAAALAAPGAAQAQFFFDTWGGRFDVPLAGPDDPDFDRPYRNYDRPYREERPARQAGFISRAEVASILSRRGYRVNPSIARNNDVYLVEAVDPSGRRMRLVVDAYDATILRRSEAPGPQRTYSSREEEDRWLDGDDRPSPPRVIPGVGPAQKKTAPKKPATARVEPRAPAPKPATAPPSAPPAAPPATAPAPSAPGPAATAPKPAPETRAEAPTPAPTVIPAPPTAAEPAPTGPRVIPLYKTPAEGASADKPPEGPP